MMKVDSSGRNLKRIDRHMGQQHHFENPNNLSVVLHNKSESADIKMFRRSPMIFSLQVILQINIYD